MPWRPGSKDAGKAYEALREQGMPKDKAAKIAVSKTGQPLVKAGTPKKEK